MNEQLMYEQQRRNKRVTSRRGTSALYKGEADRAERLSRAARKNRIAQARERELTEQ